MKDYWSMADMELEQEARKHNIGGYGYATTGSIDRKIIIDQLVARDNARNAALSKWFMIVNFLITIINFLIAIAARLGQKH